MIDDVKDLALQAIERHRNDPTVAPVATHHDATSFYLEADDIPPPTEPEDQEPLDGEAAIEYRMTRIRLDREARRRVDAEERPPAVPPPIRSLDDFLEEPDTTAKYTVDQLAPAGGRVMLAAQYKSGKTTLVGNLLRSLADAEPFLGRFSLPSPPRRIALIDTELDDHTLRRWLRDQNIANRAAVVDIVGLRGRVAALNLTDEKIRAYWATRLRELGCDYLILDCLRPVLDALGLDEHREAGQFLVAFDALLGDAGIPDALLVQHMGHGNERARGDSRLQDWPDATWRLVREDDDPSSPRFFTAYGRDVDVPEGRLSFDPDTRHLTFVDGSRKDAKTDAATPDILALLADDAQQGGEGLSGRAVDAALNESEHTRNAVHGALKTLIRSGSVAVAEGPKRSKLHRIANPCRTCGYPLAAGQDGSHLKCDQAAAELAS